MKTLQTLLITLFTVLALTAAAEAVVDLWTPPLSVPNGNEMNCLLFNVTARPVNAQVLIYSFQRGLVFDSGIFPLSPKAFTSLGYFATTDDQATCQFRVPSRTEVRGTAQTTGSTGVAAPAQ